jgi:alpha-aminoadipate/glutamate carrier protein LysW
MSALRPSLSQGRRALFVCLTKWNESQGGTESMTKCPECEAGITVQGLLVGELIYCPECNAELEVLRLEPLDVALAPQVEEDWGE